jgi:hypothetical protein
LLSCFGKLFTGVLNERLKKFIEVFETVGEEQTGFRNGYSILDNLFTLYGIIDILLFKKKRLYCAFLDYEKAFDKVNRAFLWQKLISTGITGKFLKVIVNIYEDAKSCVVVNSGQRSDFFQSTVGVRQGENLSPLLFALFLNDLRKYLSNEMSGMNTVSVEATKANLNDSDIEVFCNLFVLLYADDTVIFSESEAGLQKGLILIKEYCDLWKLSLNANKCKVIVFSRGKIRNLPSFFIGTVKLEVVSEFTYLGLRLNYNNKMLVAQRDLCNRASKAIFALIKKSTELLLPVDIIFDLFDKTIAPILTYGCELWGFDLLDKLQQIQLKIFKFVLRLKKSTPSVMVFGETGIFPISIAIKSRLLCFWLRICNNPFNTKLSSVVYRCLYNMHVCNLHKNAFLSGVESILNEIGMSNIWLFQGACDVNFVWFKDKIKRCLKDQYLQSWYTHVNEDPICFNYRMFKDVFGPDPYLTVLPHNCMIAMLKFRTTNNSVPVNKLRYSRVVRNERICRKCLLNEIGDEFHYLFVCPFFNNIRVECLPRYFWVRPNAQKFGLLFSSRNKKLLLKIKHLLCVIESECKRGFVML